MSKKALLTVLIGLQSLISLPQKNINYLVVDGETAEGIEFATLSVFYRGDSHGSYSDRTGWITLKYGAEFDSIVFACLGFYSRVFYTSNIPLPPARVAGLLRGGWLVPTPLGGCAVSNLPNVFLLGLSPRPHLAFFA